MEWLFVMKLPDVAPNRVMAFRIFKLRAKQLKEETPGMKITHAHEVLARSYGYKSYNAYLAFLKKGSSDDSNDEYSYYNG